MWLYCRKWDLLQKIIIYRPNTVLLDNTSGFGAYASMYKTDFAPSDGLGMVDGGNVVLSKYKLEDAQRIPLALRTDQGSLEQYFYLRRNILKVKIPELSKMGKTFML